MNHIPAEVTAHYALGRFPLPHDCFAPPRYIYLLLRPNPRRSPFRLSHTSGMASLSNTELFILFVSAASSLFLIVLGVLGSVFAVGQTNNEKGWVVRCPLIT